MEEKMNFNLLTVMGKVKTDSIDATRTLHNQTAGDPRGVAAAKSLGDMSHLTFMPLDASSNFSGDLLFLDIWNNIKGLEQFFSDPQVQAGANMLFSSREAIIWRKLDNFLNFNFSAPYGKNDRIVACIKGKTNNLEEAEEIHNKAIATLVGRARENGLISHEFYSRVAAPGSDEAMEVLGIDIWMGAEGMMKHYSGQEYQNAGLNKMFNGKPASSIWVHPEGEWVEW